MELEGSYTNTKNLQRDYSAKSLWKESLNYQGENRSLYYILKQSLFQRA